MESKMDQKRASNFTESDKNLLLDITEEFSSVICNKKTDATNSKMKKDTWECIAVRFNSSSHTGNRTSKQLKSLYDVIKKNAKQHISQDRVEFYKTGGGQYTPQTDMVDERVLKMLKPQLEPLRCLFDSSAEYLGDVLIINAEASTSTSSMNAAASTSATPEPCDQDVPPCLKEGLSVKGNSTSLKRKGVDAVVDRLVKRKNTKDQYDLEIHKQKIAILKRELQIKEKECEQKLVHLDMDHEIKCNELKNVLLDQKIKEMELKFQTERLRKCNQNM